MKTAIYGAGSLGTILGAYIAKNGGDVHLIRRNKDHVDALNKNGARVTGTVNFTQKVKALTPDEMTDKYDLIILATKQLHNDTVVPFLLDYLREDGIITTIQNGLPEPKIVEILGKDRVLGAVVEWGATMKGPGVSELTSKEDSLSFELGRIDGKITDEVKKVAGVLELMCHVEIIENFMGVRWSKLLINSAFSGMSAALGATFGQVAENEQSRLAVQGLIKEAIDVARAADISIPHVQGMDLVGFLDYDNEEEKKTSYERIPMVIENHKNLKASMLQDLEKGIPTEVLYINGVIRDYGKKYGVPTPFNEKVIEVVQKIEKGELQLSFDNIEEFNEII